MFDVPYLRSLSSQQMLMFKHFVINFNYTAKLGFTQQGKSEAVPISICEQVLQYSIIQ